MRKANRLGAFITIMRSNPGLLPIYAVSCVFFCATAWWAGSDLVITYNSTGYAASAVLGHVAVYLGVILGSVFMAYAAFFNFNITITRQRDRMRKAKG